MTFRPSPGTPVFHENSLIYYTLLSGRKQWGSKWDRPSIGRREPSNARPGLWGPNVSMDSLLQSAATARIISQVPAPAASTEMTISSRLLRTGRSAN